VIDPTEEGVPLVLLTAREIGVTISISLETHTHADHVTGAYRLREETGCRILVSREAGLACASGFFADGEGIEEDGLRLTAIHTPGHTDDSYCFLGPGCVFTGDTLLIRGSGRTDFQNGDARTAYRSIVTKLLVLDDETVVYPGHDYRGMTSSTVGEERRHNPRLQVRDAEEYAALMSALRLPPPQKIEEALERNRRCGAP
jgi:sulfur dioxygenase